MLSSQTTKKTNKMADPNTKNCFGWFLFAGTRDGTNRTSIIEVLIEQPYNINQLSHTIKIDYKFVVSYTRVRKKPNYKGGENKVSNYLEVIMEALGEVIDKYKNQKRNKI